MRCSALARIQNWISSHKRDKNGRERRDDQVETISKSQTIPKPSHGMSDREEQQRLKDVKRQGRDRDRTRGTAVHKVKPNTKTGE